MARWEKYTIQNEDGTKEFGMRMKWEGFSTKHYMDEHDQYQEFYRKKYGTPKEAEKIIKKLKRHFGLGFDYEFTTYGSGKYSNSWWRPEIVKLPKDNISLGIICHETAHALDYKKWGMCNNHNKKFRTCMKRVCNFAKRYI